MINIYIAAAPDSLSFSEIIEKISKAMAFLDSKDVGPWVYK